MPKNQPRSHRGKNRVSQGKHTRDEVRNVNTITGGKEAMELRTQVLEVSSVWKLK